MTYAALEEQLRQVDEQDFDFVSHFLDLILNKRKKETKTEKKPVRQLGKWKGQISMADDFDETPECFKEYM
ncbi:MAG: DUF2281 domain-containing protein [Spirochaetaceae bacterium]|nr:DUF2281 domain-containing protein [Spirochaetaceae bacterium]